jgi:hypothetical protein
MLCIDMKARCRRRLVAAAVFTFCGLLFVFEAHDAHAKHITFIPYRGSWYSPEAAYVVALCFFAFAAYELVLAFRAGDNDKE